MFTPPPPSHTCIIAQLSNLAQGYAAYDDDEFDELGGSGVSQSANAASSLLNKYDEDSSNGAGFTLTSGGIFAADPDADMTDFDKQAAGKAMSLATTNAVSNDYMTLEEQEAAKPKKKKEFKKKEKKEKKSKGKKRERAEDEGENDEDTQPTLVIKVSRGVTSETNSASLWRGERDNWFWCEEQILRVPRLRVLRRCWRIQRSEPLARE